MHLCGYTCVCVCKVDACVHTCATRPVEDVRCLALHFILLRQDFFIEPVGVCLFVCLTRLTCT